MALQKTIADDGTRASYIGAYCRVTSVSGGKDNGFVVMVAIYVNKASRDAGATPVLQRIVRMPFDPNASKNPIALAYDFVKTQPDFNGATDV